MLLTLFIAGVVLYIIGWLMSSGDEDAAQKRMDARFAEWQAYQKEHRADWGRAVDRADDL